MAYEPTNWKTGDVVTSQKLNKLEGGVANAGAFIVHQDENEVLDKTFREILEAAKERTVLLWDEAPAGAVLYSLWFIGPTEGEAATYEVRFAYPGEGEDLSFRASSMDEYPVAGAIG